MFRKITLTAALCAIALPGVAQAQEAAPPAGRKLVTRSEVPVPARMAMHVAALVAEDLKEIVPDDQKRGTLLLRMSLVAKQEALSHSCEGYTLDQRGMASVMLRGIGAAIEREGVENEVLQANLNRVLRQYHTLLGSELAQFSYDPTGYCNAGKELYGSLAEYSGADSPLVLKKAQ